jgi:hypothetical protein
MLRTPNRLPSRHFAGPMRRDLEEAEEADTGSGLRLL